MATTKTKAGRHGVLDRILQRAFKAKDAAELEKIAAEAKDEIGEDPDGDGDTHVHVHLNGAPAAAESTDEAEPAAPAAEAAPAWFTAYEAKSDARFTAIEAKLAGSSTSDDGETSEEEAENLTSDDAETEEEKKDATKDSAGLKVSFQDTMARAEILAPGIKLPTFDSKAKRKVTADALCAFRRRVLTTALTSDEGKELVEPFLDGKQIGRMTCDAVQAAFIGASELAKTSNNDRIRPSVRDHGTGGKPVTIADINKRNAEFWNRKR